MEDLLYVDPKAIKKHMDALSKIGNLGSELNDGFTRAAYSDEETAAMRYVEKEYTAAGFVHVWDRIGNLFLRYHGESDKVLQIGSHLDTVSCGGNFDGAVGIVGGLEALKEVCNREIKYNIEGVIWRGEESSTYGVVSKGCKGAFGIKIPEDALQRTFKLLDNKGAVKDQTTLEEAIKSQGFDPSYFRETKPALTQKYIDKILAHFELHIEQGNRLQKEDKDIGIVTSVRGPERYSVELQMEEGYNDGCLARILVEIDNLAQEALGRGMDLVQTTGVINTGNSPDNSILKRCEMTKISEYSEVRLKTSCRLGDNLVEQIRNNFNVYLNQEKTGDYLLVRLFGEFDHSGATPMGREYRKDANLAAAYLAVRAMELNSSADPIINYPDGKGHFLLDIRGNNNRERDKYVEGVLRKIKDISDKEGLKHNIKQICSTHPVESMDTKLQEMAEASSNDLGYSSIYMPSGAGHDSAIVAKQKRSDGSNIPVLIVFIPCENGKSHCKEEYTSIENIEKGANVIANVVYNIVRG